MASAQTRPCNASVHGVDAMVAEREEVLVAEAPLEIRCNGVVVATTMRTPGNDAELGVGFCAGEGYFADAMLTVALERPGESTEASREPSHLDQVDIETDRPPSRTAPRIGTVSSSCGVCGSPQIAAMTEWCTPHLSDCRPLAVGVAATVSATVRRSQTVFDATGGTHAAALFERNTGEVLLVREDIGRHNAVDKVIGARILETPSAERSTRYAVDMAGYGLWISGRASFEMMQKAWASGVRTLVSVSAVSSLALEVAQASGIELIGFARGEQFTRYHDPSRSST